MQKGQSLFELVVAIAISALILVAIVSLVTNSLRNANFSKNNALANGFATQTTEWLRAERDADIATFLTKVSVDAPAVTPYCFVNLDWSLQKICDPNSDFVANTPFVRQGNFTVTKDANGKTIMQADITVKWTDSGGVHSVETITAFTDWRQR